MNYNKSAIRISLRNKVRNLVESCFKYKVWPAFRVMRDMPNENLYADINDGVRLINLGAGEYFYHPKWINLDIYKEELITKCDHLKYFDLRDSAKKSFPYENVSAVYCAHTLEHLQDSLVCSVLKMIHKALEENGVFRIVVPDADLILENYKCGNIGFFQCYKSWFEARSNEGQCFEIEDYLVQLIATPKCRFYNEKYRRCESLEPDDVKRAFSNRKSDYEFLDWMVAGLSDNNESGTDHLSWHSFNKLKDLLITTGFRDVYRSSFGQSKFPPMQDVPLFDSTLPFLSMYIEARK